LVLELHGNQRVHRIAVPGVPIVDIAFCDSREDNAITIDRAVHREYGIERKFSPSGKPDYFINVCDYRTSSALPELRRPHISCYQQSRG
jgi:hypothetical protein